MVITIGGKRYTLTFEPASKMKGNRGLCDPPTIKRPSIWILKTLRGVERMEIIIHELLHAAAIQVGEDWVKNGSPLITEQLYEMGFGEGGETDYSARETIYRMLRMMHLHLDEDPWADKTANEVFATLTRLGYGT